MHDLVDGIEHASEGLDGVSGAFRKELGGRHADAVKTSLAIVRARIAPDDRTQGHRKDGRVAVARFG